uniref:F-ORF n=1 Tax=Solenaia carinata TaxID=1903492 RepID=V9PBQ9_9BIVA|nr:F-ORF [Solenaia carinata]AGX27821.1 F-ORF [Solenaia carinata]
MHPKMTNFLAISLALTFMTLLYSPWLTQTTWAMDPPPATSTEIHNPSPNGSGDTTIPSNPGNYPVIASQKHTNITQPTTSQQAMNP